MQFLSVMSDSETAMASSPCNPCSYVSGSLPPPPSPPSLPRTNTKSIEHVWNHMIKLPSLSNYSFDISKQPSTTITDSSPPTFLSTLFHKHDDNNNHSSLSASNNIKKRGQQDIYDGRHKRMIRNRESAVRSRARKQAYNYGLETDIECLREENSRLRRKLEQLQAKANTPKVGALYRTSTCPF